MTAAPGPATRISVLHGDITRIEIDAIVNAANERMLGGGGVDGAVHRAAGPALLAACRAVPEVRPGVRCPTGESRITPGFELPARYVIHTVGPVWRGGTSGEPALLSRCYATALALAHDYQLASVAFPAISCGVFRYPPAEAASIAVSTVRDALASATTVERVVLVAYELGIFKVLETAVRRA